ncbi:hypothetical protein [Azorhizobium caulinodans]|uniref:hypothetical protein n=1 Tax=Azorhizobium caulinodans TaxID=7 RepID=UPI002FBDD48F
MMRLISQILEFVILGASALLMGHASVLVTSAPLTGAFYLTVSALTFYAVGRWWRRP